jgi:hypothetical protein
MNARRLIASILAGAATAALAASAAPQGTPAPPAPAAVEVRVHVSAAGTFQDDLKLGDFTLLEDGRQQRISSLTLVKGGAVARREDGGAGAPEAPGRTYTLLFQAVTWDPKFSGVIDYLLGSILKPGDAMTLITPFKPYQLQKDAIASKSKAELSTGMEDVLRKDIARGGGEYRQLIADLRRLTRAISGNTAAFDEDLETDVTTESLGGMGLEMQIDRYRTTLLRLDSIRLVDEAKLLAFAGALKPVRGQKTVVLFYEREYRPEISDASMNRLMALYQENFDILLNLMDLFQLYKREKKFDAEKVTRAFSDAGIDFHFIFMEKKSQRVFGAKMQEQSEDIFPMFVKIAEATGGTHETSQNPDATFKRAADASNQYYLLSYVPDASTPDGGFRSIEVKVGRPGCAVVNRLGYYAK